MSMKGMRTNQWRAQTLREFLREWILSKGATLTQVTLSPHKHNISIVTLQVDWTCNVMPTCYLLDEAMRILEGLKVATRGSNTRQSSLLLSPHQPKTAPILTSPRAQISDKILGSLNNLTAALEMVKKFINYELWVGGLWVRCPRVMRPLLRPVLDHIDICFNFTCWRQS